MRHERLYYTPTELAAAAPRTVWWPAVSIALLCPFAAVAPVSLVTGMNLYLLLLVGIVWLGGRKSPEAPFLWAMLPFVLLLAVGLVAGVGAPRYLYLKDAWYFTNPATIIALGYLFHRILGDTMRGLRAFVVAGLLVAIPHLLKFAINPQILTEEATQIRTVAGTGYFPAAAALLLLVGWWGAWRDGLRLPQWLAATAATLCLASVVLSFSRTLAVVVVLGALAALGYFARREWLRVGGLVLAAAFGLGVLQSTVDTSSVQSKRTFLGKLARSMEEMDVQEFRSTAAINDNFRGYETSRALATWRAGTPAQLVFGRGFGAQVDLGIFQNLSGTPGGAVRFIPILHNGYMFLLVKTGLAGVAAYLAALAGFYLAGRRAARGGPGAPVREGRALQACAIVMLVTTWVIAGAFNKFGMFAFLMLMGYLLAAVSGPHAAPAARTPIGSSPPTRA